MSIDFDIWLDQSPEEILRRWYSTGLDNINGFTQEQFSQVGEKLAQSYLTLCEHDNLGDLLFKSFPFYSPKLSSEHGCRRFVVLDRALDNPEFKEAFFAKLSPQMEALALDNFMDTDKTRKLFPLPNVAAWMTRLSFESMFERDAFCAETIDDWLRLLPEDDLTQEASQEQLAHLRKQSLSRLAGPKASSPPRSKM